MKKKLIIASHNVHKIEEFGAIMAPYGFEAISRDAASLPKDEIEETGTTFEENSLIKAKAIYKMCKCATLADDSGILVDYLDGAPGVYSARFSGEDGNDQKNNAKLLFLLDGVPEVERTARYVCVITLFLEDGKTISVRGECEGKILLKESGTHGFGYDPLFKPDGYDCSMAEIPPEVKNKVSHRAKAAALLVEELKKLSF